MRKLWHPFQRVGSEAHVGNNDFDDTLSDDERLILYGPIVHADDALRSRGMDPDAIAEMGRSLGETVGWHCEDPSQWRHLNDDVPPAEVWSRGHDDLAAVVWMVHDSETGDPPYREEWRAVVHYWAMDRHTTRGEAMRQARVVQDALESDPEAVLLASERDNWRQAAETQRALWEVDSARLQAKIRRLEWSHQLARKEAIKGEEPTT